jgi:hypothetical protein
MVTFVINFIRSSSANKGNKRQQHALLYAIGNSNGEDPTHL